MLDVGTGVIGGMIAATFVPILFVPFFFRLLTPKAKPKQPEADATGKASQHAG